MLSASVAQTGVWRIELAEGKTFRHFRILQTGVSIHGNWTLDCSGIDLYGELFEEDGTA